MHQLIILSFLFTSCAIVHHVQVGDIDSYKGYQKVPFEVKVSETGFDIKEAGNLVDALSANKNSQAGKYADMIAMFQMGPRTGKPTYNEKYADNIGKALYLKCPSGNVTGLLMVRETASYPVVSGEIVKVQGYCLTKKKGSI